MARHNDQNLHVTLKRNTIKNNNKNGMKSMNNILIPIAFVREASWTRDSMYVGAAYFEHRRSIKYPLVCYI